MQWSIFSQKLILLFSLIFGVAVPVSAQEVIDFSHDIVPVLRERCGECHLGDKKKGSFSMNTRADLLAGSENGEVLELGKGGTSYLVELLSTNDKDIQMPPKGDRVPAKEIARIDRTLSKVLSVAYAQTIST